MRWMVAVIILSFLCKKCSSQLTANCSPEGKQLVATELASKKQTHIAFQFNVSANETAQSCFKGSQLAITVVL